MIPENIIGRNRPAWLNAAICWLRGCAPDVPSDDVRRPYCRRCGVPL